MPSRTVNASSTEYQVSRGCPAKMNINVTRTTSTVFQFTMHSLRDGLKALKFLPTKDNLYIRVRKGLHHAVDRQRKLLFLLPEKRARRIKLTISVISREAYWTVGLLILSHSISE